MALGRRGWTTTLGAIGLSLALSGLSGCSDSLPSLPKMGDLNPWKEQVPPLPGKRIPVIPATDKSVGELADASKPIVVPPPRMNDAWTQAGGAANSAPGNLALSSATLSQAWSASAGSGTTKVGRISAPPIIYDGRVYALDSDGNVSAFALSGGSAVWRTSLAPQNENKGPSFSAVAENILYLTAADGGGYGGGLAADDGRIFATSGYGTVMALDPASGNHVWEKNIGVPIRVAPTVSSDRVFVVTVEGKVYCLSTIDGAELWVVRGLPQQASLGLNASPSVEDDVVIVPYATGDVVALRVADGSGLWSESLSRNRTTSQLASMSDAARPAVDNGTVFAVSHGGRMTATATKTGERLWSLSVPSIQPPCVAGDSVFVVDTTGMLMAIDRREGKVQWSAKLPGATTWAGPVLANGILWLASKDGTLAGVDATTGRVTGQVNVGDPVYISPVVAQGRMFVLTDNAKLIAFN